MSEESDRREREEIVRNLQNAPSIPRETLLALRSVPENIVRDPVLERAFGVAASDSIVRDHPIIP